MLVLFAISLVKSVILASKMAGERCSESSLAAAGNELDVSVEEKQMIISILWPSLRQTLPVPDSYAET